MARLIERWQELRRSGEAGGPARMPGIVALWGFARRARRGQALSAKGAGGTAMRRTVARPMFMAGIIVGLASSEWLHAQPGPAYTTRRSSRRLRISPGRRFRSFRRIGTPGSGSRYQAPRRPEFTFVVEGEQTLRSRVWAPRS